MFNDSDCEIEFCGVGSCLGEHGLDARYSWNEQRGWVIGYTSGGATIATSAAPKHPSLRLLGRDASGEQAVIDVAFTVIDLIEQCASEAGL
jgi:hypothetical protein